MKMIQDGTHPEYVAQKACIDQKLDEKERLADAQYKNGMESLEIATRVTKAQVHSQYYQRVRELRENTLNKCSELWYHIQRERRAGDTLVSGLSCLVVLVCLSSGSNTELQNTPIGYQIVQVQGYSTEDSTIGKWHF
jgi:hypothetical protein